MPIDWLHTPVSRWVFLCRGIGTLNALLQGVQERGTIELGRMSMKKEFIIECQGRSGNRYEIQVWAVDAQSAGEQAIKAGHAVLFVENRE